MELFGERPTREATVFLSFFDQPSLPRVHGSQSAPFFLRLPLHLSFCPFCPRSNRLCYTSRAACTPQGARKVGNGATVERPDAPICISLQQLRSSCRRLSKTHEPPSRAVAGLRTEGRKDRDRDRSLIEDPRAAPIVASRRGENDGPLSEYSCLRFKEDGLELREEFTRFFQINFLITFGSSCVKIVCPVLIPRRLQLCVFRTLAVKVTFVV